MDVIIVEDANLELERLYCERETLMCQQRRLLDELRTVSQIKATYSHVVKKRFHSQAMIIPSPQVWTKATREFHELCRAILCDLMETRLALKRNRAEICALQQDAPHL